MKKKTAIMVITLCILLIAATMTSFAADGGTETLTIRGDGVEKEITFTRAELEDMTEGIGRYTYSTTNNFPTDKLMYREGISLDYLLEQVGMKDSVKQLKFKSSDGYVRTFTLKELCDDKRYSFTEDGRKLEVITILAFSDSGKDYKSMSPIEMSLTMGQRVKGEQNNPWFVKYLKTIEVSTDAPGQWEPVTFTKAMDPNGVAITPNHPFLDSVKIYFTTDGTNPDINSSVYNVSATYYQPQLNKPILMTKDGEIRAIAIGAGKHSSEISSTTVHFSAPAFSDLGDYPWARTAIEDLAGKSIISGMGNGKFAPEASLTRAQFATMIVLAKGEMPATTGAAPFKDIKSTDWHYGYVKKAVEMGLIKGYPDGTFRPDRVLSRQEMLTIAVQATGAKVEARTLDEQTLAPFVKEERISDWARGYVAFAEKLGLLEHGHMVLETKDGLAFNALGQTARAEAAVTVYRMLQLGM